MIPVSLEAVYFSNTPLTEYLSAYHYPIQEQLEDFHFNNNQESVQMDLERFHFWMNYFRVFQDE